MGNELRDSAGTPTNGLPIQGADRFQSAFTLIEILVVLSIVSILLGVALPAVQSARESARVTQCQNRIRQLVLGAQLHEAAFRHLPTGGWGFKWVGQVDRGVGQNQPGGWIYNTLPYVEAGALHEAMIPTKGSLIAKTAFETELPLVRCPSRPSNIRSEHGLRAMPRNTETLKDVVKTDFAACEGDFITDTRDGPPSLLPSDVSAWRWVDTRKANGVCFQRSMVRLSAVTRGLSQTYFCGEKQVSFEGYHEATDLGYDQSALSGVDVDIVRWTKSRPRPDSDDSFIRVFGSAHGSGFSMGYLDGAVKLIHYDVDAEIHRAAGTCGRR